MAAIEEERQRADAAAAAQKAAYLQQSADAQQWGIVGGALGVPPQVARHLHGIGMLDDVVRMIDEQAAEANERADEYRMLQLGASAILNDPNQTDLFELLDMYPWVREEFGYGATPTSQTWKDMVLANPELALLAPDVKQEVIDSFGDIGLDEAYVIAIAEAMLANSPEGQLLLEEE
jgi:hypothetical protein